MKTNKIKYITGILTAAAVCSAAAAFPGSVNAGIKVYPQAIESIFPDGITISEPVVLGDIQLPDLEYGSLFWKDPGYLPEFGDHLVEIVMTPYQDIDLAEAGNWNEASGELTFEVLLHVGPKDEVSTSDEGTADVAGSAENAALDAMVVLPEENAGSSEENITEEKTSEEQKMTEEQKTTDEQTAADENTAEMEENSENENAAAASLRSSGVAGSTPIIGEEVAEDHYSETTPTEGTTEQIPAENSASEQNPAAADPSAESSSGGTASSSGTASAGGTDQNPSAPAGQEMKSASENTQPTSTPVPQNRIRAVQTGDESDPAGYGMLLIFTGAGLIVLLIMKKKIHGNITM